MTFRVGWLLWGAGILLTARAGAQTADSAPGAGAPSPGSPPASAPATIPDSTPAPAPASAPVPEPAPAAGPASAPEPASAPGTTPAPGAEPAPAPPASAPAISAPPKPAEPPKKPSPEDCPAVSPADYGAFAKIHDYDWLPDGGGVLYLLSREDGAQLWLQSLPPGGATLPRPRKVTRSPGGFTRVLATADGRGALLEGPAKSGVPRIFRIALDDKPPVAPVEPPLSADPLDRLTLIGLSGGELLYEAALAGGARVVRRATPGGYTDLATLENGERALRIAPDGAVLLARAGALFRLDAHTARRSAIPFDAAGFPGGWSLAGFGTDGRLLMIGTTAVGTGALFSIPPAGGAPKLESEAAILAAGAAGHGEWTVTAQPAGPELSSAVADEIPRRWTTPDGSGFRAPRGRSGGERMLALDAGPLAPGDLWLLTPGGEPARLTRVQPPDLSPRCALSPEAIRLLAPEDAPADGWLWKNGSAKPRAALIVLDDAPAPWAPFDPRAHHLARRGWWVIRAALPADAAARAALLAAARARLLAGGTPASRIALWGAGGAAPFALESAAAAPDDWAALVLAAPHFAAMPPAGPLPPLILFPGRNDPQAPPGFARALAGRLLASGRPFSFHELPGAGPDWPDGADRSAMIGLAGKFLMRRVENRAIPKAAPAPPPPATPAVPAGAPASAPVAAGARR